MSEIKILTVLGTRPEIIKLSPLIPLFDENFHHILVHSGQHYSYKMDRIFFEELRLRHPDYTLEVGSSSHAEQTGKIMASLEPIIIQENPDLVVVQGDTNTTLSGALTTAKLNKNLAHVEAGCRSFNRNMPEEINRVVADHLSQILFAADQRSYDNLVAEGIAKDKIRLVGSTLTDACLRNKEYARDSKILSVLNLKPREYVVVTVHRAENTDNLAVLESIIEALNVLSSSRPIVFPVHPRTNETLNQNGIKLTRKVITVDPLGYIDFLKLLENSIIVMSDSGGIQEEAVVLDVPCAILRDETEWTRFVDAGKNIIVGTRTDEIIAKVGQLLDNHDELERMRSISTSLPTEASQSISRELEKAIKVKP